MAVSDLKAAPFVASLLVVLGVAGCGPGLPGSSAPPPLPPGARANHSERTYPVRGVTRAEIGRSLSQSRVSVFGDRFQGVYSWRVTWSYRYAPVDGACRMRSVEIRLESETRLPMWEDRERADSALAAEWDTYIGRLRAHENNHRAIAHRSARELHRQLRRVTSPTCGTMSGRANALAREIVRRHDDLNRKYDEETGHGRTEGVAWPLPVEPVAGGSRGRRAGRRRDGP